MTVLGGLPASLRDAVIQQLGPGSVFCEADLALALLRVGTSEALDYAGRALGVSITRCPSAVPPWPPKPVRREAAADLRVSRVVKNPCRPTTGAFQRFKHVKVGMTEEQLRSRGVSTRDLRVWVRAGYVEFA